MERDKGLGIGRGFTLAEVLVTIGIVGIVAAITLPVVFRECQKFVLRIQFKKTYSTLSQALQKAQADLGYIPQCYYKIKTTSSIGILNDNGSSVDCNALNKAILNALNISQVCNPPAYPNCIPKYKGFDTMEYDRNPNAEPASGLSGFWQNKILYNNSAYALADGSIIICYGKDINFPKIFAVDINGKKGPNKWGYDLFAFWTGSDGVSPLFLVGTTYYVEENGVTTADMLKDIHEKY